MGLKKKDVTFIGIHNRRTDHLAYHLKEHNHKPLKPSFFYDAMDSMREDFNKPAFLFVSDDMQWDKQKIKDKHGDLFFVGSGDTGDPMSYGADLAVMALSNATIITRGTFSMFGHILSGGPYHTEYSMMWLSDVLHPDDPEVTQELKF